MFLLSCFFLAPAFFLNNFFIRENLVEHCFLAHDFFSFTDVGRGLFSFSKMKTIKKKKTDKEACIAVSFSYYYYQTGVGGARVYDRAQMTASSRTFKSETTAGDGK